MRIQQFLEHHGVSLNPFADEDAQTDPVFKDHCIASTYHPAWDKVYGNPTEPSTAVVFGEKGSGKTAMRLQIVRHLREFNRSHPGRRAFVIQYDDFNPFLDRFRDTLAQRKRRPDRLFAQWKLWDHMDAILSLGVTKLIDMLLKSRRRHADQDEAEHVQPKDLDRNQARDLLILAACYDRSLDEPFLQRWGRLRRALGFRVVKARWQFAAGILATLLVVVAFARFQGWSAFLSWWPYVLLLAGWAPWLWRLLRRWWLARGVARQVRVVKHETWPLCRALLHFTSDELGGQPLPNKDRTDDRYELLVKFQDILRTLGYEGVFVLVDRVDEPYLVNGSADMMKSLVWPLLDNKLLKHQGMGFKLLLPIDLAYYVERESRDFHQRARLDKQNMVPSLAWTGEALYDVAQARLLACALPGARPSLRSLFDEDISDRRLLEAFRQLRTPRHLFKFMYRLLVAHCNAYSDEAPVWRINSHLFESVLAVYLRDQEAMDRSGSIG